MSLNSTPSAERVHIGFFGLRNAGKSSVVNAVTGQELALVSDVLGTTTDPVKKAMELLPLGAVVIIDTPGVDDEGELGRMRVKKATEMLDICNVAVLVADCTKPLSDFDKKLIASFEQKNTAYIIAYNKSDLFDEIPQAKANEVYISAKDNVGINELKEKIAVAAQSQKSEKVLVSDLIKSGDTVVLVVPIDASAPKGRLILPQQQTIREIIESGAIAAVCRDSELEQTLAALKNPPALVITDSQVFGKVAKIVPQSIPLTSFSMLFMRYKGNLEQAVLGANKLDELEDNDKVLIAEGCTHHRQCEDIGTVKMPRWVSEYTKKKIEFAFCSGNEFPDDLSEFALVIHCGGCMLNERQMQSRMAFCAANNIGVTNYGVAISKMNGILKRTLSPFEKSENN